MRPDLIAINQDEYHTEHIGRTKDGRQFILTSPFVPASDRSPGSEFVALYLFDSLGKLLEAKIENLGPRATLDEEKAKETYQKLLQSLGNVSFERVEVAPFSVTQFDTEFGLITREPEDEDDVWAVEMQPGNYLAFFEPWDSGDYDT